MSHPDRPLGVEIAAGAANVELLVVAKVFVALADE
jgi:hypothetical protein